MVIYAIECYSFDFVTLRRNKHVLTDIKLGVTPYILRL
jgi:hypothetical protein